MGENKISVVNGCVFLAKSALRSLKATGNVRLFIQGDTSPRQTQGCPSWHRFLLSTLKLNSPLVKQQGRSEGQQSCSAFDF